MEPRLLQPEMLWWLCAVPVIAVLIVISAVRRRAALRRFADDAVRERLIPGAGVARGVVKGGLNLGALLALIGALVDPRWGVSIETVPQRGVDLIVVLDISKSMLARDARPDRLERARQSINDLLIARGTGRVGLITFAGTATLRCPLTSDDAAFRLALELAEPESAARGGSLLGDALRLAAESFSDDVRGNKAIIVFSDGEDQGSYPIEAAQHIRESAGIPIFTVGIGDAERGARIPLGPAGSGAFVMVDDVPVISRMDRTVLEAIARASDGLFIPLGTRLADLGQIYDERIQPMAGAGEDETQIRRYTPRYQWFAALALILLLTEAAIPSYRPGGTARAE